MTTALASLVPVVLVSGLLLGTLAPPRISLSVQEDILSVRLGWLDALYCVSRSLRVPLTAIEGVAAVPRDSVPRAGMRLPGTALPGVIRAGSYRTRSTRDFWDIRRGSQVLVVELRPGATYRRLVLEVPDAHAEALHLRPALGSYAGTFRR